MVVEISKTSLRIAYFSRSGLRSELLDYSLEKINPETDLSPQIVDLIRAFLKKSALSIKEVILSIADQDPVSIKYCLLPALKHSEVKSAAIWQLKDEVHFDLKEAYSDWRVVKEFTDEQGARQQGMIFVFSRKEAVEKYLSCLRQCNLHASAIVTSALNYANVLQAGEDQHLTCEMVLDLGYADSTLNLYIDKKPHFTRALPVSVDGFTRSLIGTLLSDNGRVELTLNDAEEIRDTVGIPQDETASIRDNLQAGQVISLIRPVLENLVTEARHSIAYFTTNLGEPSPQIIYLAGPGANLKNLDIHLQKALGLPVTKLPFPKVLDIGRIDPARGTKDQGQIISCVGAALSDARGISLSSGGLELRRLKEDLTHLVLMVGGSILSLMLISLLMFPLYSYRLKTAKDHFKGKIQLLSFFEKARPWDELLFQAPSQRVPADAVLNFISRSVPDGIRMEELELDQYQGELTLQGTSGQAGDVDVFLKQLDSSGFFSRIKMEPLEKNASNKVFKITCKLRY